MLRKEIKKIVNEYVDIYLQEKADYDVYSDVIEKMATEIAVLRKHTKVLDLL